MKNHPKHSSDSEPIDSPIMVDVNLPGNDYRSTHHHIQTETPGRKSHWDLKKRSGRLEDDDPSGYSHSFLLFVESVFVDVQLKTNV